MIKFDLIFRGKAAGGSETARNIKYSRSNEEKNVNKKNVLSIIYNGKLTEP